MTVDREELRRLVAEQGDFERGLHQEIEFGRAALEAIPELLDSLDAADRRIAELESSNEALRNKVRTVEADELQALAEHDEAIADLTLRLQVATDANVVDRKRIDALEAGLREALHMWADEVGLARDANGDPLPGQDDDCDRLRAMLPEGT